MLFCFKQKAAYERRISDWSSDVCSSDLEQIVGRLGLEHLQNAPKRLLGELVAFLPEGLLDDLAAQAHVFLALLSAHEAPDRSEERRVGTACVSTCRSRSSPTHENNQTATNNIHTRIIQYFYTLLK